MESKSSAMEESRFDMAFKLRSLLKELQWMDGFDAAERISTEITPIQIAINGQLMRAQEVALFAKMKSFANFGVEGDGNGHLTLLFQRSSGLSPALIGSSFESPRIDVRTGLFSALDDAGQYFSTVDNREETEETDGLLSSTSRSLLYQGPASSLHSAPHTSVLDNERHWQDEREGTIMPGIEQHSGRQRDVEPFESSLLGRLFGIQAAALLLGPAVNTVHDTLVQNGGQAPQDAILPAVVVQSRSSVSALSWHAATPSTASVRSLTPSDKLCRIEAWLSQLPVGVGGRSLGVCTAEGGAGRPQRTDVLRERKGVPGDGERWLVGCISAASHGVPSAAFVVTPLSVDFRIESLDIAGVPPAQAAGVDRLCTDAASAGTMFVLCERHAARLLSTTSSGMSASLDVLVDAAAGTWLTSFLRSMSKVMLAQGSYGKGIDGHDAGPARSVMQAQALLHAWLTALEFVAGCFGLLEGEHVVTHGVRLAHRVYEAYVQQQSTSGVERHGGDRNAALGAYSPPTRLDLSLRLLSAATLPCTDAISRVLGFDDASNSFSGSAISSPHLPAFLACIFGTSVGTTLVDSAAFLPVLWSCVPSLARALQVSIQVEEGVEEGGAKARALSLPCSGVQAYVQQHTLDQAIADASTRCMQWAESVSYAHDGSIGLVRRALPWYRQHAAENEKDYKGADKREALLHIVPGPASSLLPSLLTRRPSSMSVTSASSLPSLPSFMSSASGTAMLGADIRAARATAEVREARSSARRAELENQLQVRAAKQAELARLEAQAEDAAARRRGAKRVYKEMDAQYAQKLRIADERGSSPLKGGTLETSLYEEARNQLLNVYGGRLAEMAHAQLRAEAGPNTLPASNNDAVHLALEALASLGSREAKQAASLAEQMNVPWGTSGVNAAVAGIDDVDSDSMIASRISTLNLFRALPELERILPCDAVRTIIRVTQAETGGHDSVGGMLGGISTATSEKDIIRRVAGPSATLSLADDDASLSVSSPSPSHIRVSQPPGGHPSAHKTGPSSTHVRVTQPAGGRSTVEELLYGDGTTLDGALEVRVQGRAQVAGKGEHGGSSEVQALLYRSGEEEGSAVEGDGGVHSSRFMHGPGLSSPGTTAALSGTRPHPDDGILGNVHTSVRVLQPAGGSSTAVASLILHHTEERTSSAPAVDVIQPLGAGSTIQSLLYPAAVHSTGSVEDEAGEERFGAAERKNSRSIVPAGGVATIGLLIQQDSYDAIPPAPVSATSKAHGQTGSIDGSAVAQLLDHIGEQPGAAELAKLESAEAGLSRMSDALRSFQGYEHARASGTREENEGEEEEEGRRKASDAGKHLNKLLGSASLLTDVQAGTSAISSGLHAKQQNLVDVPLGNLLHVCLGGPISRRLAQLDAATVAATVLHAGLLSHYTALRAWMLLGSGHVMSTFLDKLRMADEQMMAQGGDTWKVGPDVAAVLANNALASAQADAGMSHAFAKYVADIKCRARANLARMAHSCTNASDAHGVPFAAVDSASHKEKLVGILRLAGLACSTPAEVAHLCCFRYDPPARKDSAASMVEAKGFGLLALLCPSYDPSRLPMDFELKLEEEARKRTLGKGLGLGLETNHTVVGKDGTDQGAGRLLAAVLTPASLRVYAHVHTFLLRLRWVASSLRDSWLDLMAAKRTRVDGQTPTIPILVHEFRHTAVVWLAALDGHVCTFAIEGAFARLIGDSRLAVGEGSLRGLQAAHATFVRALERRALLALTGSAVGAGTAAVLAVLDCVQSLCISIKRAAANPGAGCSILFTDCELASLVRMRADLNRHVTMLRAGLRASAADCQGDWHAQDLLARLGN